MAEERKFWCHPSIRDYIDQSSLDNAPHRVLATRTNLEKMLSPFESWLMSLQSLLIWEKPLTSGILLGIVNLIFWRVSTSSNHMLGSLSYSLLVFYVLYIWKTRVWPTIRAPTVIKDEEWVPVHAKLLSVPDICRHLADGYVTSILCIEALRNLRRRRKKAFTVLMLLLCLTLFTIGHHFSGLALTYTLMMSLLLCPCAVYHNVFGRIKEKTQPHITAAYDKLMSKLKTKKTHKQRRDRQGNTAETDSEDELMPTMNPDLIAALARTITDSEDEGLVTGGRPSCGTRDPSVGRSTDIEHIEGDMPVLDNYDEQALISSLEPEVSQMPDFENVCDDSNAFMLEADVMPGMDDIDSSRLGSSAVPNLADADTDSENDPLPKDRPRGAAGHRVPPPEPIPANQQSYPAVTQSLNLLAGMAASLAGGFLKPSEPADARDELLLDPRDRLADASVAYDDGDFDADFEVITPADLGGYTGE